MSSYKLSKDITGKKGSVPTCALCCSTDVVRDAFAQWNSETGQWALENAYDQCYCLTCDADCTFVWKLEDVAKTERIRHVNDQFRMHAKGRGTIILTQGINELEKSIQVDVIQAIQTYTAFSSDNDPHGEHDFGDVQLHGLKVFFKFDYYDNNMEFHSPDAGDESVTKRVLTVMLADEY